MTTSTHLALVLIASIGCSSSNDKPPPAATPPAAPAAADPACVKHVADVRAYLDALQADGGGSLPSRTGKLADIDAPPSNIALLAGDAVINIDVLADAHDAHDKACTTTRCKEVVSLQGRLLGTADQLDAASLRKDVAAIAQQAHASSIAIIADADAPWSTIAAIAGAATAAKLDHVDFVLHATGTPHASPPPPSSIDAAIVADRAPADPAAPAKLLSATTSPTKPPMWNVFKDCAPATALFQGVSNAKSPADALAAGLPDAIAACSCKVEVNAVERVLWALWDRDQPTAPIYIARLKLRSTTGPNLKHKSDATWASASTELVKVAQAGDPVGLTVD